MPFFETLRSLLPRSAPEPDQPSAASLRKPSSAAEGWPNGRTLLHFETADARGKIIQVPWTFGHSFEGLFVSGATGSGKTSGTGRRAALSMLKRFSR